jgi:pilus assembly protein CpaE
MVLRSAIICPDRGLSGDLNRVLEDGGVHVIRVLDEYLSAVELVRFARAHAPQIVFLSIECMQKVKPTIDRLEECCPGIQVIAIHRACDQQMLLELMRLGIREFLASPFDRNTVAGAVARAKEALDRRPIHVDSTDLVYSFLPAKAGVGTTTVALNTAVAISRSHNTRTLLSDFDLNSGIVRFMLKLDSEYCVVDAAERALNIDENFWPQLVTPVGSLDVLHAGKLNPNFRMEPIQVRNIVEFARRNYKVVCFDLSGNLEKYSVELMHESKRVFLVCTPEIPSLHLAREKYQYLQSADLGDRVTVILNRTHKKNVLTTVQIQELLGVPLQISMPNDYQTVTRAIAEGRPIDFTTDLGKQCEALAQTMLEPKSAPAADKRRFIEFFSITPPRLSFETRKTGV